MMAPEQTAHSLQGKTYEDYYREGWTLHGSKKDEVAAEEDFRQAIALDTNSVEAYYGLGLVLKAQDRRQEAIAAFQKVVDLLEASTTDDRSRSHMLRRLSIGHMNMLKTGDWNLEKEIWQRIK
jgi:cytochrome c-type biogenesis protein CcmH/NrfG